MAQLQDELGNAKFPQTYTEKVYDKNGDPINDRLPFITEYNGATVEPASPFLHEADIVNNLTTNDPTKPLSAAQGYALNSNLSELPKVQSGTCPSGSGEKSVTFSTAFSSAPNVVVTPFNTATPTNFVRSCTITEVTKNGFKFYEMASNGSNLVQGTDACYWIAVGV